MFGATFFLFVLDELQLGPAILGLVAGVGGASSFIGAVIATRATKRWGIGRVAIVAMLLAAVGNAFIPLAPAGLPVVAVVCLVMQQLVGGLGRDGVRRDRGVGSPDARPRPGARTRDVDVPVAAVVAQLVATLGAGLLAEVIGLRATAWLAPLGGLIGAAILFWSPVRSLDVLPEAVGLSPAEIVVEVERDQPVGG